MTWWYAVETMKWWLRAMVTTSEVSPGLLKLMTE